MTADAVRRGQITLTNGNKMLTKHPKPSQDQFLSASSREKEVLTRAGSVSVFQNIVIPVSVFGFSTRTYHCLSNNTIADTLRPPLLPQWGMGSQKFALRFAAKQ